MKKTLLAALIAATALVPATAFAQDRGRWAARDRANAAAVDGAAEARPDRGAWRQQSQQSDAQPQRQWNGGGNWRQQNQQNDAQPQRQWGGGNWRRQQAPETGTQTQVPQASEQQRWGGNRGDRGQWSGNRSQWNGGDRRPDAGQYQQQQAERQQAERQQQWRNTDRSRWNGDGSRWNGGDRGQYNRGNSGWNGTTRNWSGDRNRGSWNNNWRNDRRYDWRGYRGTNRNLFRLPRYYAPSGWGYGYRRFGIGFTLNSILYSQRYWINDPFYYRLPEVDGPYRWVRYYNDALLVDIYTGEVVDTIYDIFW